MYLFVLAVYRGDDPIIYIDYVKNYFFNFLLFTIFLSERVKKKYQVSTYVNFIVVLTLIQALLGLLQYYIPEISDFFKIVTYERYGKTELAIAQQFKSEQVVTGTLLAMQNLSSFLLLNIIFLGCIKYFKIYKIGNSVYWVIIFSIATMLLTGVRAPLLGLFISFFAILWFANKKLFLFTTVIAFVVLPILVTSISSLIEYSTTAAAGNNFENPLIRILGIFAIFDSNLLGNTTLSRSMELIQYLFQNPIFGFGPGFIFSGYSFSDAFLILLTIEFGLLGVFILILPYIITLKIIKKKCTEKEYTVSVILFITALSQSIVNEGLWTWYTNLQFFLMMMLLLRVNVKNLNYKLKLA
ncbi:hypothetical protein [Gracilimonas sp.]|uniref:hypothetical protein n=1 Tax=Gracilimonas sp. TaxID=1974203 RepID=UPI0032EE13B0